LYCGDCADFLKELPPDSAIVSDPPYGCDNDCDYSRFTGGKKPSNTYSPIAGDDQPFDPSPWLVFPKVVLFGFQFFAQRLPVGTVLVWQKKRDNALGKMLSDCELAWMKGGKGVYLFQHIWNGFDRDSERGRSLHPTQKPVALFDWVLRKAKIQPDMTVVDPYMGSGSVLALYVHIFLLPFLPGWWRH